MDLETAYKIIDYARERNIDIDGEDPLIHCAYNQDYGVSVRGKNTNTFQIFFDENDFYKTTKKRRKKHENGN